MWEQDTLNVPLTLNTGLPSDRRTGVLVLGTGGRWWKCEADWDGCINSISSCAEIDLAFKLPTLSDFNLHVTQLCPALKIMTSTCTSRLWVTFFCSKSLVSGQRGDKTDERDNRRKRLLTYWTGRCEPLWAECRRLNPSQNGLPARNGTECQASDHPQHMSPLGWRTHGAGGFRIRQTFVTESERVTQVLPRVELWDL